MIPTHKVYLFSRVLQSFNRFSIKKCFSSRHKCILPSLVINEVDEELLNPANYQFFVSKDYDDIYQSLSAIGKVSTFTTSTDLRRAVKQQSPNVFRTFISVDQGGIGIDRTNFGFLIERLRSNTHLSYLTIVNQLLCLRGIIKYGTSSQKQALLPLMLSGDRLGAFCLYESSCGSNIGMMEATANYDDKRRCYRLNGIKNWVTNATSMDLCLVFVRTNDKAFSAFLVDRPLDNGCVSVGGSCQDNLLHCCNVADVTFNGLEVPSGNLLGNIGDGFKIANELQNGARFAASAAIVGLAKDALRAMTTISDQLSSYQNSKMMDWAAELFAVETAIYFTTNVTDDRWSMEGLGLEDAAVKVASTEIAYKIVDGCIQLSRMRNQDPMVFVNLLYEIHALDLFLGSMETLRQFVGGSCLKECMPMFNEDVIKRRNPYDNMIWNLKCSTLDDHPTSFRQAKVSDSRHVIDVCMDAFRKELITALSEYGFNFPNQDLMVGRFGTAVIAAYHLLVAYMRYQLAETDKQPEEAKHIMNRSIDIMRNRLIDTLGEGKNRISFDTSSIMDEKISKVVTKSTVHGIESALARNW